MITEAHADQPILTGRAVRHPKRLVTDCHTLDLARIAGQGGLSDCEFWRSTWRAWCGVSEVEYVLIKDASGPWALALAHRDSSSGKTGTVAYAVMLDTTIPYFGGRRFWFRCPHGVDEENHVHSGDQCDRRVRIIYLPPGAHRFGCRDCHALTYVSRQQHRLRIYEHHRAIDLGFKFANDLASRSSRVRLRALRRASAVSEALERALIQAKRIGQDG